MSESRLQTDLRNTETVIFGGRNLEFVFCMLALFLTNGCGDPAALGDEDNVVAGSYGLTAGLRSASNNDANCANADSDCINVDNDWTAMGVTKAPRYTGIDNKKKADQTLIGREKVFAAKVDAKVAVYGAHGEPGDVQGVPDPTKTRGTVLESAADYDKYVLSVCNAGTATIAPDKKIAVAKWIKTKYGIAVANIIACDGGQMWPGKEDATGQAAIYCTGADFVDGALNVIKNAAGNAPALSIKVGDKRTVEIVARKAGVLDGLDPRCAVSANDYDDDGIDDAHDNCPNTVNTTQSDLDADGMGDACDTSAAPAIAGSWIWLLGTGLLLAGIGVALRRPSWKTPTR